MKNVVDIIALRQHHVLRFVVLVNKGTFTVTNLSSVKPPLLQPIAMKLITLPKRCDESGQHHLLGCYRI